jgi:pyrimidine-nucleoside phosphorylase
MNPVEMIRKKRSGGALTEAEIEFLIAGYVRGDVPDYQMSAFLMAVYFQGMSDRESACFTETMLHSGSIVDLSSIPGVKVDKHSTGGVGDKVSLILAPMVAACGVPVPMISGRGLGHTGGTLDKLEAIPGFRTDLSMKEYVEVIRETGLVLIGQTPEIAPADRKMYALRDVTSTVESIPLIAGSIMSKKLAEGIDALVLDVKTGNGAFMQTEKESLALARALVGIGAAGGKPTAGLVTSMDQPLGQAIGNWWEVVESVECLRGKQVPDLMDVTLALGGLMLKLGGKASTMEAGIELCRSAIWSGRAYEKFLQIVSRQGGDTRAIENLPAYPPSLNRIEVTATDSGYVHAFKTREIGVLATELGAGRSRVDEAIDPKAGIIVGKKIGEKVEAGDVLAVIMTDRPEAAVRAADAYRSFVGIGREPVAVPPVIRWYVDIHGVKPYSRNDVYPAG